MTVKLVLQFLDRRGYTGIRVRVQESLSCKRLIKHDYLSLECSGLCLLIFLRVSF